MQRRDPNRDAVLSTKRLRATLALFRAEAEQAASISSRRERATAPHPRCCPRSAFVLDEDNQKGGLRGCKKPAKFKRGRVS